MSTTRVVTSVCALLMAILLPLSASAAVPTTINYQGYLTDSAGAPVTESKSMVFSLYGMMSGTPLWTETQPAVAVTNGVYSVSLGSVTPVPASVFNGANVYLGVTVGTDAEMTPRQKLTSVGFAFKAADADTVGGMTSSSFAADSHGHAGGDITSGTVLETRVDAAIARDGEVSSSITTHTSNAAAHHTKYTDAEAVTAIKAADGTGSALDADLLDGQHAEFFSTSTHDHTGSYVLKAGDTMTGALILPADGLTVGGTQLVLSGGKVGVGATPSLSGKFQVANPNTTGQAGYFQISNAANSASALVGQTNGTGSAGEFLGDVKITGNLDLAATTSTSGMIKSGANRLIHTYGASNFFAGINAGNLTMTGGYNTASGSSALFTNTTGYNNTASGVAALYSNESGHNNTASGYQALSANTSGYSNSASGSYALYSNNTGGNNTASGAAALYSNISGSDNTASGSYALRNNNTASMNTAVGKNSLFTQSYDNGGLAWGSHNTAVGFEALYSNQPTSTSNGIHNTALGSHALKSNSTGYRSLSTTLRH